MWFDGLASVIIGLILGGTVVWLAYVTKGLLIGEAADPGVTSGIRGLVISVDNIEYVQEVLTMHIGQNLF